ncbi:MAG: sigma-54 interaction domain-containing protein [Methylobacter sp.]
MLKSSFTLESLLETHDLPFVIIDVTLRIVAVNRAWETSFGITREQQIGKPCCNNNQDCRHKRLFQKLEPYDGIFPDGSLTADQKLLRVRGYPLLDIDDMLYIGESISVSTRPKSLTIDTPSMAGTSPAFLKLQTRLQQAAETLAPVMLTGETGTGKELACEFIHRHSRNANGEFVIVDCTILGESLFESEVFGHEKGAFTSAASSKKGLFELANNGTLFFDEIGELPLSLQPKLLRALESGQFRRVGGTVTLSSKVRVVCATHRNLSDMVKEGKFREDLFYRLSVFLIELPPLRERKQDLPVLIEYLLLQLGRADGNRYSITQQAQMKLLQHSWPGNIRELKNCLQLATCLCRNKQITEQDINIVRRRSRTLNPDSSENPKHKVAVKAQQENPLDQIEVDFLNNLINKYNGNRKLIAAEMNISERTLYRKLNRFNLN